ncbi:hypothetical protein HPG69_018578 [Diceros bicornis minor]|uniref:Phenylethanolamine N-methyltransferase n=1 Tax=Diceros bicornis minor TaxID=77932 RepID=A0A7J7EZV5_DICBM|nr:hypothetical protein HPG69_018578 [Diceros bicornis minor]
MALQESVVPDVYQVNFEPTASLDYFKFGQNPAGDERLHFLLKHYNATFKSGRLKGKLLIDIGSGPTIYQLPSACESLKEIITTDYLTTWTRTAWSWRNKWAEKEERLGRAVRQVLKCDILKERPLEPAVLPWPTASFPLCALRLPAPPWGPAGKSCATSGPCSGQGPSGAERGLRPLSTWWGTRGSPHCP